MSDGTLPRDIAVSAAALLAGLEAQGADLPPAFAEAPDSQTFYPLIDSANPLQPFFIFAPQLIKNARKLADSVQSVCPSIAVALESHIPFMLTIALTVALIIALTIALTGAFAVPVPLAHRRRPNVGEEHGLASKSPFLPFIGGASPEELGTGAVEEVLAEGSLLLIYGQKIVSGRGTGNALRGAAGGGGHENEGEDDEQRNNNSQTSQRKRRKVPAGWRIEASGGPPVTKRAGELLGKLLAIYGRQNRLELDDLLVGTTSELPVGNDMAAIVQRLSSQSKALKVGELQYMLALVQLVLHVDSLKADAKLKYLRKVTLQDLAEKYAPGTHPNTFRDWVNWGKRLLLLCAARTCYILPIIAALDLRTNITRKSTTESDVLSLATALREVRHGKWLPMVRRLMVPIYYLWSTGGYIQDLRLHCPTPVPDGQSPKTISFGFGDIQSSDEIFDRIETNYPKLLPRSSEWDFTAMPAWKPLDDPRLLKLALVHVIQTPLC
ncbi:hypothetical protein B0H17DRAFT_1190288 [Mycena rosella]|uniref:Uncharacterized protein n=1 Tax=Mycena rosella TaxID=1033263 RepID=A0AAD7H270_MYCRO|nr:hypothetical protein B0H17DRAFT_1190288 [Mycena rosella]